MNEKEVLEWLNLGLDISDDLSNLRMDGKTLVQKTIAELTRGPQRVSTESALKIYKETAKASERDMESFNSNFENVLRKDDLRPIGELLKIEHDNGGDRLESIVTMFGKEFYNNILWHSLPILLSLNLFRDNYVSPREVYVITSLKEALYKSNYKKILTKPLISRVPADFFGCKDFLLRLFGVMRKFPMTDDGPYRFLTKRCIGDFIIGETYVFPSFVHGYTFSRSLENSAEDKVILKLSGTTTKGHKIYDGINTSFTVFEPETTFIVTKIENDGPNKVVHGEFVEGDPPIFEDTMKEFEAEDSKTKEDSPSGPKYVEESPKPLDRLMNLEDGYKGISLDDAIRKAKFEGSELILARAKEKESGLKRISKDFDLTEEDVKSIFIYTLEKDEFGEGTPYCVVNEALSRRDEKQNLRNLREYIFYLLTGLRHLPRFKKEKVLYRGVKIDRAAAKKIYREGRTLYWTSFSSTTTDEDRAYEFVEEISKERKVEQGIDYIACDGVIFEIHGKFRGYSIGTFSRFTTEEEVLLEPDTKFTVMMVAQDEKNPTLLRIVLDVKETEPILESELGKFKNYCESIEKVQPSTNPDERSEKNEEVPRKIPLDINSRADDSIQASRDVSRPFSISTRLYTNTEVKEEQQKEKEYQKQLLQEYQEKYPQKQDKTDKEET